MNLCLINSASGWGGGERMFLELALGFQEAGHAVTVVCRPGSMLQTRLRGSIELYPLRCAGDFDLLSLVRLVQLFRRQRFAAVFCNQGRDCVLAGFAALPLRLPILRVKAMEDTHRNLRNLLIYRVLLSGVVSVSRPVQDGLLELRIPPGRLHVIHNGVVTAKPDIDRSLARRRFAVQDTDFVVAYTGRLVREKGVDLLPEVAAQVVAGGAPLRLLVAGEGALRDAVEAECTRRQLQAHVSFLGFLDDPLPLLVAADAAIMPSRTEAFPVAALEALAMQTPLVACAVGGVVEIVTSEETALLVPAEDPRALAAALLRLYRDKTLADALRLRGRARAAKFSRPRMIRQYEDLVHQLSGE